MELCVDLNEITRIPYHELETVYFSVNFTVLPDGKRFLTGPSFGKKSIQFRPHCFKFTINDIQNSHFSLTIFSHLTDNRTFILSYLKIPLMTVPVNGFTRKSFETMLTHSISSLSPIVTLTIGINIDYRFEKFFEHPSIVDKIEYDKFESPPIIELNGFGKLIPPKNYIDKCSNLVEKDSDIFLKLISNDSLRKYVLDKATEYFNKNEDISSLYKDPEKKKDKISNQTHDYGINIIDKFSFFQKGIDSETKKAKFKKDSDNKISDHSPQPPVEPKSYYQSITKNKNKISNEVINKEDNQQSSIDDDSQSKAYVRQFSLNPKIRTKPKTPTKSLTINRTDPDPSQSFQKIDSPSLLTQKSQFVQQQQQQQQPKFLPQTKVPQQPHTQQLQLQQKHQQIQPQQSIKIQSQSSQQKLRQQFQQPQNQQKSQQQLQLQLPSSSRPQQPQSPFYQTQPPSPHHPPQTQSPFHQIQNQPSTAEIGIHKMISKKKVNESEIGIQKILQQKNNLDCDKNQGRKQLKRSIVQNQKPNPPQIQLPIASLPTSVENSGNPRRARQNP